MGKEWFEVNNIWHVFEFPFGCHISGNTLSHEWLDKDVHEII